MKRIDNIKNSIGVIGTSIKTGHVVKFTSIKEAQNRLKISNISTVCNGDRKSSGGYYWKYNMEE